MHARELWESDAFGPRLARLALTPAATLYAIGWQSYLAMYRLGIKRASEPHRPIVCVGNLVVGGAGKTPLTLHLVEVLRGLGREVVVGCSGYGAPHAEAASIAPDGPLNPREWGDEPAMFRWLLPDVPLVVGRRRVLAAELVQRKYPNAVLLMDDGFQHLPLRKQLTLLLDEREPKNPWCLPAGPYREPRRNRARADEVIPGRFRMERGPMRFVNSEGGPEPAPEHYGAICALGNPRRFLDALATATGRPAQPEILLPDHDSLDTGTLFEPLAVSWPVVVTAKDWVKLRQRNDLGAHRFLVALQSVRVEPAAEFRNWLSQKLHE